MEVVCWRRGGCWRLELVLFPPLCLSLAKLRKKQSEGTGKAMPRKDRRGRSQASGCEKGARKFPKVEVIFEQRNCEEKQYVLER